MWKIQSTEVWTFLRVLDALEMKSEKFQQSANNLEETSWIFFVTIVLKNKTIFF